jgi:hypothetical protein
VPFYFSFLVPTYPGLVTRHAPRGPRARGLTPVGNRPHGRPSAGACKLDIPVNI